MHIDFYLYPVTRLLRSHRLHKPLAFVRICSPSNKLFMKRVIYVQQHIS